MGSKGDNSAFLGAMAGAFRRAYDTLDRETVAARNVLTGLSRVGCGEAKAVSVALLWMRSETGGRLFGFFNPRDLAEMYTP